MSPSTLSPNWRGSKNASGQLASIEKVFSFDDFVACMAFANRVAALAEQQNHHPTLLIQYSTCVVRWSTHDAGNTVTARDVECAALTDGAYLPPAAR